MARAIINVQALDARNKFATAANFSAISTALDGAEGGSIAWNERDDKYLLLVQNTHASADKEVTIKAGNGIQGTADIKVTLAAGKYTFVSLDSGRFKNVSGENKGKVVITGAAEIKVACFKLP